MRGRGFGLNNDGDGGVVRINSNRNGSRGGNNNSRASFRGFRGGRGVGDSERRETTDHRQGEASGSNRNNAPSTLSVPEIKKLQEETTNINFSSSELSFKG